MKKLVLAGLMCGLLCGCSHRLVDFTMISTKNVPIGQTAELAKAGSRVEGIDSKSIVLGIPLGMPNMKEAIDKAIESYPGAVALSDGVIYSKGWHCFFYGQNKFVVQGTPVYPTGKGSIGSVNNAPAGYQNQNQSQYQYPNQNQYQQAPMVQIIHEVQNGETLSDIAAAYKVSIRDIASWNRLNSNVITPGTRLLILVQ